MAVGLFVMVTVVLLIVLGSVAVGLALRPIARRQQREAMFKLLAEDPDAAAKLGLGGPRQPSPAQLEAQRRAQLGRQQAEARWQAAIVAQHRQRAAQRVDSINLDYGTRASDLS